MKFSKKIIYAVIALNILFTAAVLYVCQTGNTVPDSLVIGWFSFTGTELVLLAGIKKHKLKKEGDIKDEAS